MIARKGRMISCLVLGSILYLTACKNKNTLFQTITPDHSGIHFNNQIIENDSINPLDMTNIYNGGGVGIGDFNRDGLQDIYFTGNTVSNRLYLNKGDFKFEDITAAAGVDGEGNGAVAFRWWISIMMAGRIFMFAPLLNQP